MATYYMASAAHGGSDSNSGTIGSPFLTAGHAATVMVDGDTLNANGGDSFASTNVAFGAGVGATIQSYGTGQASFAGLNSASTLFFTNPASAVVVQNITVTNADNANAGFSCVRIAITDGLGHNNGLTITGCTLTGGSYGFQITNRYVSPVTHTGNIGPCTVTNNTVTNSDRSRHLVLPGGSRRPQFL